MGRKLELHDGQNIAVGVSSCDKVLRDIIKALLTVWILQSVLTNETVGDLEKEFYNLKKTCSRTGFSAFDLH